ncbi:MAG: hypothetical protein ACYSSO_10650 [Planctomycetota bacterium]|jgi:hypothetical protein
MARKVDLNSVFHGMRDFDKQIRRTGGSSHYPSNRPHVFPDRGGSSAEL